MTMRVTLPLSRDLTSAGQPDVHRMRVPHSHASSTVAPLRMCPTNAAAGIHSPLYSPGTLAPVVMRHCGRFGTVSKTVVGLTVDRGFESLPLR
jgi:hypothetical protein